MLDAQLFPMTEGVKMKLRCRDVIGKTVVVDFSNETLGIEILFFFK